MLIFLIIYDIIPVDGSTRTTGASGGSSAKANVNYTGTMIGNGKSSNGTKSSQYIVSPETDVKTDAMATHV